MNTPRHRASAVRSIVFGVGLSLVIGFGTPRAAGFGAVTAAGSVGPISGGQASAVASGGAHSTAPMQSHGPTGFAALSHPNHAAPPFTATSSGPSHFLPGGVGSAAMNRPAAGNTNTARVPTVPAPSQSNPTGLRGPQIAPLSRVNNAWTDRAATTFNNLHSTIGRYPQSPVAGRDPTDAAALTRNGPANRHGNRPAGTFLYPSAPKDVFGGGSHSRESASDSAHGGYRGPRFNRRSCYSPYLYNYPYVIIGGYTPDFYGNTGYATSSYADGTDGPASDAAGGIAPVFGATRDFSRVDGVGAAGVQSPDGDADAAPPAPSSPNLQSNTGPDSLVEAVQAELSRRGYFGDRIDAVYNEATHTAIQRFQTDQRLAVTGRINEATLHALQLD